MPNLFTSTKFAITKKVGIPGLHYCSPNLAPGGRVEVAEEAYSYLETNGYSRPPRRCATALKHDTSIIIGLSCIVITMLLYNTNATTKLMLPNYRKQHDTKN